MTTILRNLTLRMRLNLLVAGMLLGLIALGAESLFEMRRGMLDEKRQAVGALVDTALGVVEQQYKLQQAGGLSQEEAQKRAKDDLRGLRYGDGDYFWINDMTPRMVMHPTKPELDGKDLSGVKDPDGKPLFLVMVEVVK